MAHDITSGKLHQQRLPCKETPDRFEMTDPPQQQKYAGTAAAVGEQVMTSLERILDKGSTYTRFRIAIRVMQEVLTAAPEPVCTGTLEHAAGCSSWLAARVCSNLALSGMLSPAEGTGNAWLPGPLANSATLADILCSEIVRPDSKRGKTALVRLSDPVRQRHTDAFVLQATMNINQTVLEQLRRFPLRKAVGNATAFGA